MKKISSNIFKSLIFSGFTLTFSAHADMPVEQHKAHVHGLSELMIAAEGNHLEIHLESPAIDLVGFEHKAVTEKQIAAIQKARKQLSSPTSLFTFSGANCVIESVDVDTSSLLDEKIDKNISEDDFELGDETHEHDHEKHEHEHEKNEHQHDHDKHQHEHEENEHKHDHDKHQHEHEYEKNEHAHYEIAANYLFKCEKPTKLSAIEIRFFDLFPNMQHINSMWITETGQNSKKLDSNNRVIRLK